MIGPKHLGLFLFGLLGILLLSGSILVEELALGPRENPTVAPVLYDYWPYGLSLGVVVFLISLALLVRSKELSPSGLGPGHLALALLALLGLAIMACGGLLAGIRINADIITGELVFSDYWPYMLVGGFVLFIAPSIALAVKS